MMKSLMAMLVVCCLFAGCMIESTANKLNQSTFAAGGQLIGKLPDGREIKYYQVERGGGLGTHHLYVVDGSTTTTINRRYKKTDSVEILVDGTIFVPKETP